MLGFDKININNPQKIALRMTSHDPSPTKNVIQTYFTAVATKEMPLILILYQQCPKRLLKSTGNVLNWTQGWPETQSNH